MPRQPTVAGTKHVASRLVIGLELKTITLTDQQPIRLVKKEDLADQVVTGLVRNLPVFTAVACRQKRSVAARDPPDPFVDEEDRLQPCERSRTLAYPSSLRIGAQCAP